MDCGVRVDLTLPRSPTPCVELQKGAAGSRREATPASSEREKASQSLAAPFSISTGLWLAAAVSDGSARLVNSAFGYGLRRVEPSDFASLTQTLC